LTFLSFFLPCCLLPFLSEGAGPGAGAGGHRRVWVGWEPKARGLVKSVEGIVVVAGNSVALHWRWGIGGMVGGSSEGK
jgi:hypothetical protein